MCAQESVFGHLAMRFGRHPENLATEALLFIVRRSTTARRALIQRLRQIGPALPDDLTFSSQVYGDDDAIPDLVATDAAGQVRVVVEVKFWAGLTENQPVVYVGRLSDHLDALLVFIAPAARRETLWPELVARCKSPGGPGIAESPAQEGDRRAKISDRRWLAILSWRDILDSMLAAVQHTGERNAESDLLQLQGLCGRMDEEQFLPLRSEELTGDIGRRVLQLYELVDDVCNAAAHDGLVTPASALTWHNEGWAGRYVTIGQVQACVTFNPWRWATERATPLWLQIQDEAGRWKPSKAVHQALAALERANPARLIADKEGLHVPLFLPPGLEKDALIKSAVEQVREVAQLLGGMAPAGTRKPT